MADNFFAFIGTGDCYIDMLSDTGMPTGLKLKGNCNEFTPKPDSEIKELTGNGLTTFGTTIASVVIPKPMTATIKFNQLDADLFAAAFFGTTTALSQSAATAQTKELALVQPGQWYEIGARQLSNVSATKSGGSALTAGVDYRLNERLGLIQFVSGGAATAGSTVEVTYDCAQVKGSVMAAMTKSNVRIRVLLDGRNYADGRRFAAEIYQMKLAPSSDFSLIGDDFVEVTFEGSLEKPNGKDTPMTFTWFDE